MRLRCVCGGGGGHGTHLSHECKLRTKLYASLTHRRSRVWSSFRLCLKSRTFSVSRFHVYVSQENFKLYDPIAVCWFKIKLPKHRHEENVGFTLRVYPPGPCRRFLWLVVVCWYFKMFFYLRYLYKVSIKSRLSQSHCSRGSLHSFTSRTRTCILPQCLIKLSLLTRRLVVNLIK